MRRPRHLQPWTPNQIIAGRIAEARRLRGWTQEEAAERLAPYLGARWSSATFSQVERSVDGKRVRQFTADELLALSRGFDVPIGYFLTPLPFAGQGGLVATPDGRRTGFPAQLLIDALIGTNENFHIWLRALEEWAWSPADVPLEILDEWREHGRRPRPDIDRRSQSLEVAKLRAKVGVAKEFGDLEAARDVLTRLLGVIQRLGDDRVNPPGDEA